MRLEQIINDQQALLNECKEEFIAAIRYDSLNDHLVEKIISRIDAITNKIKTEKCHE
jgi:hypothetical protein